ncbi:uncharacterized protein LOC123516613 isoform X2 [Portunus trituberculatus]|nr:uncharacterized protein LOC123516613 isoform X2 [Portunus trituberculatus]
MEQYILPSHSVKPASMTKLSMPFSPQPGPSQQNHHLPSSQPEVQPTSLHSLPQQPPQVTKHADTSKCETPLSTPSPQAGPSWDVAPLPSSSPPKAALPAAGPGRRRNGKLDNMAITPRMLTIQNGILSEMRNIGASLDKIGDQLEVMNSTFSSHLKAMTGVLQVIANSLVESAYKEK